MESLKRHIAAMEKISTDSFTIEEIEKAFDGLTKKCKIPDDDAAGAWRILINELAMIHLNKMEL